jgi:hypothetical protein
LPAYSFRHAKNALKSADASTLAGGPFIECGNLLPLSQPTFFGPLVSPRMSPMGTDEKQSAFIRAIGGFYRSLAPNAKTLVKNTSIVHP